MRRKGNGRDRGVRGNGPSDENGVQKEKGNRVWHRMLCKISSWQITDRSVQTSIHAFQAPILFFFFCSISLSIFSLMYYYLLFSFLAYIFFFFLGLDRYRSSSRRSSSGGSILNQAPVSFRLPSLYSFEDSILLAPGLTGKRIEHQMGSQERKTNRTTAWHRYIPILGLYTKASSPI